MTVLECETEIHRLEAENKALKDKLNDIRRRSRWYLDRIRSVVLTETKRR